MDNQNQNMTIPVTYNGRTATVFNVRPGTTFRGAIEMERLQIPLPKNWLRNNYPEQNGIRYTWESVIPTAGDVTIR